MSDSDDDDSNDKKKDLTRIEDLSEFLHEEDPDSEAQLEEGAGEDDQESANEDSQDVSDLPDLPGEKSWQESEESPSDEESNEDNDDFDFSSDEDNDFSSSLDDGPAFEDNQDQGEELEDDNSTFEISEPDEENNWENSSMEDDPPEEQAKGEQSFEGFDAQETFETEENSDEEKQATFDGQETENLESQQENQNNVLPFEESEQEEEKTPEAQADLASKAAPDSGTETQPETAKREGGRENFQEVREFGTHMTYGHVGAGGNPPYSVVLRNIQYQEDAEDILSLLREHGILNEQNEKDMRQSVEMGALLISQISEYAAIYLAHRLRRFSLDMQVGLSEDIHPPKSYRNTDVGLSSKRNLQKGRSENLELSNKNLNIDDIVATTSERLTEWDVLSHLGILTEHSLIKESDISGPTESSESEDQQWAEATIIEYEGEDKSALSQIQEENLVLDHLYQDLISKLKKKALRNNANGILNISFQLTPLSRKPGERELTYKITCTGNLVQLQKRE